MVKHLTIESGFVNVFIIFSSKTELHRMKDIQPITCIIMEYMPQTNHQINRDWMHPFINYKEFTRFSHEKLIKAQDLMGISKGRWTSTYRHHNNNWHYKRKPLCRKSYDYQWNVNQWKIQNIFSRQQYLESLHVSMTSREIVQQPTIQVLMPH